jgi:serine protease SohB
LLKKHDIDYELLTAGEYKRTLTVFGENTEQARQKFLRDMEDLHLLFKEFIQKYRPQVELAQVATGEHWPAIRAVQLKLVDSIQTSDDYLFERSQTHDLFEVSYKVKKRLGARVCLFAQNMLDKFLYNGHSTT